MENYKVRVNNAAESKEVQELFEQLGYMVVNNIDCEKGFIVASKAAVSAINFDYWGSVDKELTIQQLRNLVAAKTKKAPYLVKTIDGWEEQQLTSDTPESATCLKVPDGANNAVLYKTGIVEFFKSDFHECYHGDRFKWFDCSKAPKFYTLGDVIWQRQTQPEELPFIDDDPKIADIEQTLNERQSQYGDFSDVAETTQSMYLMLLNDDMTDVEREALHMICSKLSRIKHGDCHKIDSWHDIGGYATLVVKDLEQNNG